MQVRIILLKISMNWQKSWNPDRVKTRLRSELPILCFRDKIFLFWTVYKLVRFPHNWNGGTMEYWNDGLEGVFYN